MDFYSILFFLYGTILGSFYNVVGLRVPENKSLLTPGSSCPACRHKLGWFELIPVLSYLFLKGKCRKCRKTISPLYPGIELLAGLLFVYSYWHFGFSAELAAALVFSSLLIIITVTDLVYMIIPDKILLLFGAFLIVIRTVEPLNPWWDAPAGSAAGFFLLFFIAILSKGGMGGGDIKLYAVIGLVLGVKLTLLSFFLATLIGTAAGLIGLMLKGKNRKDQIPFGPSIAAGSIAAYFWGYELIDLYIRLLFT
ncbi:prepilin peptidase [Jeotgalibacillus proteolyticus]|uniref:Prepilin peptidase n=1 Tax=Jeotgalibacillus proteolyticus TaxID=2082395 RepID=A0A2S5GEZ1_9BACL|nr:A24 family peptidase [Jeotgalibacillus proteolyticus]PPA71549.1 prepilin peptidase [Jeotgalibacillus proteolyticus]